MCLGHTLLGWSKKASVKSKKKLTVPRDSWTATENTYPPLVDEALFQRAQENLGRSSRDYRGCDHVRKSIFGKRSGVRTRPLLLWHNVHRGAGEVRVSLLHSPVAGHYYPPVKGGASATSTWWSWCGRIWKACWPSMTGKWRCWSRRRSGERAAKKLSKPGS